MLGRRLYRLITKRPLKQLDILATCVESRFHLALIIDKYDISEICCFSLQLASGVIKLRGVGGGGWGVNIRIYFMTRLTFGGRRALSNVNRFSR